MRKIFWIVIAVLALLTPVIYFYGIDQLVLGSDELHPARIIVGNDWSLTHYPWPKEAVREYYDNWPVQFPPLFGLLTRASVVVFGAGHFALRFFPALFALCALFASFFLFRKFMKPELAAIAGLVMGWSSDIMIDYAKFFKHYTADVLCAIIIFILTISIVKSGKLKYWFLLALVSATSIWLAFASFFAIATAFGLILLHQFLIKDLKNKQFWLKYVCSGLFLFCSFIALYFINIANAVSNPVFLMDWGYQIFNWQRAGDAMYWFMYWKYIISQIVLMPAYFFNMSVGIGIVANILILVWVTQAFLKKDFENLFLMLTPMLLLILASFAGKYPFYASRLSLILLPLWIIMIYNGAVIVFDKLKNVKFAKPVLVALLIVLFLHPAYSNVIKVKTLDFPNRRQVDQLMYDLKDQVQDGDTVMLHWGAILAFYFYFTDHQSGYPEYYATKDNAGEITIIYGEEHRLHPELNQVFFDRVKSESGRLWVVFCHQWPNDDMLQLKEQLDASREQISYIKHNGCRAFLYGPNQELNYNEN